MLRFNLTISKFIAQSINHYDNYNYNITQIKTNQSQYILHQLLNTRNTDSPTRNPIPLPPTQHDQRSQIPIELRPHIIRLTMQQYEIISRPLSYLLHIAEYPDLVYTWKIAGDLLTYTCMGTLDVDLWEWGAWEGSFGRVRLGLGWDGVLYWLFYGIVFHVADLIIARIIFVAVILGISEINN
jgi:hypothetical protein